MDTLVIIHVSKYNDSDYLHKMIDSILQWSLDQPTRICDLRDFALQCVIALHASLIAVL